MDSRVFAVPRNRSRRLTALMVVLLLPAATHAAPAHPQAALPHAPEVVVVGGDAAYPPFQILDGNGEATGFDIELMRLLADDLGVDVRFELGDWDESLKRLSRHEIDIVPMFMSDLRGQRFLFTRPYMLRYHAVFGRRGQAEVADLGELRGHTVAVQDAGLAWEALQTLDPVPALVTVETEPEALHAVARGEAEYALVPTGIGFHAISVGTLEGVIALSPALLEQRYVLAVRKDRPDLASRLNDALARVRANGEQDRLYRYWVGQIGVPGGTGGSKAIAGARTWWWMAGAVAVLLGALGIWRRYRSAATGAQQTTRINPDPPQLLSDLRQAIADGTLGYALQPKLDLRSGLYCGAELLVRWNHLEHGPITPGEFVPLAEEANCIAPMTLYLVRHAVKELASWPELPYQPTLSVNVAADDLADPVLLERIIEAATGYGHALILEVTETGIMHDPVRVADALPRLRAHGIRISLDDFGTGHSSLSHLRRFAVDELKIDRSFVTGLIDSESDQSIVRAIIQLSHDLGTRVAAEGIEDDATRRWLTDAGCDVAQGFGIARPMLPADFAVLLREQVPQQAALRLVT